MKSSNSSFRLQGTCIRLARELWPLCGKPSHDIGDILWRHRLTGHVVAPIGSAHVRPSDNYSGPKILVAHQSEIGAIHDGTGPLTSSAVCAVTRRAVNVIYARSALLITGSLGRIRRRMSIPQCIRLAPAGSNSGDDDVDLVVGQHSAGVLRKRRHSGSCNSVGGYATNRGIVGDGEVNGVSKSDRGAALSIRAVASGTVPGIEETEIHNLGRRDRLRICWRAPGCAVASAAGQQRRQYPCRE